MSQNLTANHQATYETIFRHPISHNLGWRSLISVFKELGEVEVESNGKLKFTRNGHALSLTAAGKDAGVEEIMRIRHFLKASELPEKPETVNDRDVIVIVDHKGARIYRAGSVDLEAVHVEPIDPRGYDRQVHNPLGDSGGQQHAYRKLFFESIAAKLVDTDHILFIGDGRGASSEVDHLFAELASHHHKDIEKRIIGKEVLDLHHLTEAELLVQARELFSVRIATLEDNSSA